MIFNETMLDISPCINIIDRNSFMMTHFKEIAYKLTPFKFKAEFQLRTTRVLYLFDPPDT